VREHQQRSPPIYDQILKVLYAPRKAFEEITQTPKYIGPILILILFVAANVAFGYILISRSYVEQTLPNASESNTWSENATMWDSAPSATVRENFDDFINGSYYGNRSIEFSMPNSSRIFMELTDIGSVNCSGPDGYNNMSLRVKIVNQQITPANASIYLFSQGSSSYFYYNLTNAFTDNTIGVWNNQTEIPLTTEKWVNNGADWGNITGLKLEFGWLENSNITVLVDGVFFRGVFKTPLDIAASSYLLEYSLVGLMEFVIQWILLGGLMFILAKAFGAKTSWTPILVSVGFALIILFVQTVINAIAASTLPSLYYPLEYIGGTQTEVEAAVSRIGDATSLVTAVSGYVRLAASVWIIALCAIAARLLTKFSWTKSVVISAVSFIVTLIIGLFIGI
jgi:hypothetical protein